MTPHQTLAVVVRLFAIWLAIFVVRAGPSFYRDTALLRDSAASAAAIAIAAVLILFVLFLWFFPRTVARALLNEHNVTPSAEPASPDTWFAVGCALLGLWLMVPSLGSLIWRISVIYLAQRDPSLDTTSLHYDWIYYGANFVLGFWLLLGARGARKLFWWARARSDGP